MLTIFTALIAAALFLIAGSLKKIGDAYKQNIPAFSVEERERLKWEIKEEIRGEENKRR